MLSSLFAFTFASRAASSTLDDLAKQLTELAEGGHITREDFTNLQNCIRKCGIDFGKPLDANARKEAARCAEVHTVSVTCTGCPKKMY